MNITVMNLMLCHNECYKEVFFSYFFMENLEFGCTGGKNTKIFVVSDI